ncbi:hypothetical protein MPER_07338, partial [Moniliophthora perniciosa FA553]
MSSDVAPEGYKSLAYFLVACITRKPPVNYLPVLTFIEETQCLSTEEWALLHEDTSDVAGTTAITEIHDIKDAPLITQEAYEGLCQTHATQYGVFGKVIACRAKKITTVFRDPRLYLNTNAPFSAVVCGVQGSGKSHSVSVILENMFIPQCPSIGLLQKPLSGLVLHFGEGGAAPSVNVNVSKSSLNTMKKVYAPLMKNGNVKVEPLLFDEGDLDAQTFLSMMAVGSSDGAPLYIQILLSILRDLGENFKFNSFMRELDKKKKDFNPAQLSGLQQRLSLLEGFMRSPKSKSNARLKFSAGQLTIVDLSDPFIDPVSACSIFEVITRLFVRAKVDTGKVLVLDEAHKYLAIKNGSSSLAKSLLGLMRLQRHLAMRVIISTQ